MMKIIDKLKSRVERLERELRLAKRKLAAEIKHPTPAKTIVAGRRARGMLIFDLWVSGEAMVDVAKTFGVSMATVSKWVRRHIRELAMRESGYSYNLSGEEGNEKRRLMYEIIGRIDAEQKLRAKQVKVIS